MPNNTIPPEWWNQTITWAWVMLLSIWGGTVHTIRKIKEGTVARFSISEWIGDMVTAGFIGVVTYALCQYSGFDSWMTAAIVGISSHQGTRGLTFLEQIIAKKLGIEESK